MTTAEWIKRIELLRAQDGIDGRVEPWETFTPRMRRFGPVRPLPIGPTKHTVQPWLMMRSKR